MTTAIVGASGEHYVAAYLSALGLIVALPRAGVKGSDLLIADEEGHPLRIQVKTGRDSHGADKGGDFYSWDTSYSVLNKPDKSLWFAYIWLNNWPREPNLPEVFFVPAQVVVAHMEKQFSEQKKRPFFWLYEENAKQYRGLAGFELLKVAMQQTSTQ